MGASDRPVSESTIDAVAETAASSSSDDAFVETLVAGEDSHAGGLRGDLPARIGRYRILRVLGRGGMGTVYAAHDPELGRDVALKSLRELGRRDVGMAERLRREAQALARVVHPHVVPVYDAGVAGDTPFLIMQLIDGETLDDYLARAPRTPDEIVALFAQAALGLRAIHEAGLVHRDIKPSNLLVDRAGVVRVSDLGLARIGTLTPTTEDPQQTPLPGASGSGTITRGVVGTPAYMAPEQFEGVELTPACDQFSFCVALWEALFGERPFTGTNTEELARAVHQGQLRAPPRGRPVPAALLRALRRGLSTSPLDRFPSMQALLDALQPPRRLTWLTASAGAVVIGGGVVAALALAEGDDREARAPDAAPARAPAVARTVTEIDAGKATRVTFADSCEEFPAFSPDGKTVYYDGQVGRDYHLFALDIATSTTRELTQTAGWDYAPAPSPDGKRIAFVRRTDEGLATFVADLDDLAAARALSPGPARPSWSPDGRHVWTGARAELARFDVDTGVVTRRIQPPENKIPLLHTELPDGRFLILGASAAGTGLADTVYLYGPDGGAPTELFKTGAMDEVLAVAPEGDAVLVAPVSADGTVELVRVPLDGGEAVGLGPRSVPARKQLALSTASGRAVWSDCAEQTGLAAVSVVDGKPALVDLPRGKWADAFPQGVGATTRMMFLSDRAEGLRIWELDRAKVGPVHRVPFGDLEPVRIAVSLDGTMIAGAEGSQGLFVAPVDGSAPPRLLVAEPGELSPSFSRDGTKIFYERLDGDVPRVASVPVAGGEPTWVVAEPSLSPVASPTADVLAYLTGSSEQMTPMLLDLATGKTRRVPGVEPYPWTGLRWSTDGKRLLVVRSDGLIVEIDARSGKEYQRIVIGADMTVGATYVGDEIIVGRARWNGDLWTAPLRTVTR